MSNVPVLRLDLTKGSRFWKWVYAGLDRIMTWVLVNKLGGREAVADLLTQIQTLNAVYVPQDKGRMH